MFSPATHTYDCGHALHTKNWASLRPSCRPGLPLKSLKHHFSFPFSVFCLHLGCIPRGRKISFNHALFCGCAGGGLRQTQVKAMVAVRHATQYLSAKQMAHLGSPVDLEAVGGRDPERAARRCAGRSRRDVIEHEHSFTRYLDVLTRPD